MVMLVGTLPTISPQKTIFSDSLVVDNDALDLSFGKDWRLEVGGWGQELQIGNSCLLRMNGQKLQVRMSNRPQPTTHDLEKQKTNPVFETVFRPDYLSFTLSDLGPPKQRYSTVRDRI